MVESMNIGDYCAEGRELYTTWKQCSGKDGE